MTNFSSPLLVGFETIEKSLERVAKSGDGYPPYNIERIRRDDGASIMRITRLFASFAHASVSHGASSHPVPSSVRPIACA